MRPLTEHEACCLERATRTDELLARGEGIRFRKASASMRAAYVFLWRNGLVLRATSSVTGRSAPYITERGRRALRIHQAFRLGAEALHRGAA